MLPGHLETPPFPATHCSLWPRPSHHRCLPWGSRRALKAITRRERPDWGLEIRAIVQPVLRDELGKERRKRKYGRPMPTVARGLKNVSLRRSSGVTSMFDDILQCCGDMAAGRLTVSIHSCRRQHWGHTSRLMQVASKSGLNFTLRPSFVSTFAVDSLLSTLPPARIVTPPRRRSRTHCRLPLHSMGY